MKAKIYILVMAALLIASCEKEETHCLKKIEHYTIVPGKHKRVLIFYAQEVPEGYIENNVIHRFAILEDCPEINQ